MPKFGVPVPKLEERPNPELDILGPHDPARQQKERIKSAARLRRLESQAGMDHVDPFRWRQPASDGALFRFRADGDDPLIAFPGKSIENTEEISSNVDQQTLPRSSLLQASLPVNRIEGQAQGGKTYAHRRRVAVAEHN